MPCTRPQFVPPYVRIHNTSAFCIDNPELEIPIKVCSSERELEAEVNFEDGLPDVYTGPAYPAESAPPGKEEEIAVAPINGPPSDWASEPVVVKPAVPTVPPIVGGHSSSYSPVSESSDPSFGLLLDQMTASVNDLDIINDKVNDDEWSAVFLSLTPVEFGSIMKTIDLDHYQSKVAGIVAEKIDPFTCNYVIAAIRTCSEWNRVNVIKKLLPLCSDLEENKGSIIQELTDWERFSTEKDFNMAA